MCHAERELRLAVNIGASRQPPLQLVRLRRELAELRVLRPGIMGFLNRLFRGPAPKPEPLPADEEARRELERSINRLAREQLRRPKRRKRIAGTGSDES